ncbi:MAG: hypothetical protein AAF384_13255 [Pseudomonadota bacterium]
MTRLIMIFGFFLITPTMVIAAPDLDQAASDACDCLKAPYQQIEKATAMMKEAQASGDMSQMTAAQGEMMAVMNAGAQCFGGLQKKYPEIDQSDELKTKVMGIVENKCPRPIADLPPPPGM